MEEGLVMGIRLVPPFNIYLGIDPNRTYTPLRRTYDAAGGVNGAPALYDVVHFDRSQTIGDAMVYFSIGLKLGKYNMHILYLLLVFVRSSME